METLSNFLLVGECLLDQKRVDFFEKIISNSVKKGDIVVDAGTGSGIMALLAARAGAKKVFAIEIDKQIAGVAQQNVQLNGYEGVIKIVGKDVCDWHLPQRGSADVVIMEMLDTGLIAEQQAEAIFSLKRNGVITEKTLLLPSGASFMFDIVHFDFDFVGFNLPFILQARNFGVDGRVKSFFSRNTTYAELNLRSFESLRINEIVSVRSINEGLVNAIRLRTRVESGRYWIGATSDMNMPIIVPIEPFRVKVGQKVRVGITYSMGRGVDNIKITALPISK